VGDILKRAAQANQPIPPQGPFFQLPKSLPQQFFSLDGGRPGPGFIPFDERVFAPAFPFGPERPGGPQSSRSPSFSNAPQFQIEGQLPQALNKEFFNLPMPRVPVPSFPLVEPGLVEDYFDFLARTFKFQRT